MLSLRRGLSLALLLAAPFTTADPVDPLDFDWETITPSRTLRYHDCYSGHQCARLEVPLDWLDPTNPHTVAIALVKRPAAVPPTDPTYGGPVLLNPGGPGGSGVVFALGWAERLQEIVDGSRHYDIIGFDPRGVGRTTPRANCYDDELARAYEGFQAHGSGYLRAENPKLGWRHALSRSFGKRCERALGAGGGILRYATSSSVARDMVEIIDREEELNEGGSGGELKARDAEQKRLGGESVAGEKKPARLQYIGFSYGTLLGNTFASMFPGRVGRMVLDGVADIDDYMAGTWEANLLDADLAIEYLYKICSRLGTACPISDGTEASWQDLKAKVDNALEGLARSPIPIETSHTTVVVSDLDIMALIFTALYKPNAFFYATFTALGAVLRDDRETLAAVFDALMGAPSVPALCGDCDGPACSPPLSPDAQAAIACSDGLSSAHLRLPDWAEYFQQLANQSAVGYIWSEIRFKCANWDARPPYRFDGPFSSPAHDPSLAEGRPAAPLLFLSSRIDPVTPLTNAYAMAARHPGSAVVAQESVGHCALATAVSSCTAAFIKQYFENGTVPEGGAVCAPDCEDSEMCALEQEDTAPVPLFGMSGLPLLSGVDQGRMQELNSRFMQLWH